MSLIFHTLLALQWMSGAASGASLDLDDPLWDDGKAEVCHYDAETVLYGVPREHITTTVFVKEDFGLESKVKVDEEGSEERVSAIKAHSVERIETENYPYQRARTTIAARSDLRRILRETSSSQEWCGITSARIIRSGGKLEHRWDSYFEGEPVGIEFLPTDGLTDHQLLLVARNFGSGEKKSFRFPLLSGIESNRGGTLEVRSALMSSSSTTDFSAPVGTVRCRVVQVHADEKLWMTLWIELAKPHRLIGLDRSDGHKLRLRKSQRWAYWQRGAR